MKIGIVIYSNDAETVWNAFRLGVFARKKGDTVGVFLLGKGVECETLDTEKFNVMEQIQAFVDAGGLMMACGTCLKLRHAEGSAMCPVSTMSDLYQLLAESDKIVSF